MDGHIYHIKPLTDDVHKRASLNGSGYHVISRRSLKSTFGVKSKTSPILGSYDCTTVSNGYWDRRASLPQKFAKCQLFMVSFLWETSRRQKDLNFNLRNILRSARGYFYDLILTAYRFDRFWLSFHRKKSLLQTTRDFFSNSSKRWANSARCENCQTR